MNSKKTSFIMAALIAVVMGGIGVVGLKALGQDRVAAANAPTMASMPPVVVHTVPEAGMMDVDPAIKELRVTFSKPMRDKDWAWAQISNDTFPKTTGSPHYLADHRTCVLPVQLRPKTMYVIWLNRPPFDSFQDIDGHRAMMYLLTFQTK